MQVFPLDFLAMTQGNLVRKIAPTGTIHDRIKERREGMGLSMQALAHKVGVAWQTVQQWENGKTSPTRRRLPSVAEALGCSPDYLFFGKAAEDMPTHEAKRPAESAGASAAQCEPLSPDEINSRLAELEAVVRAGALQAGVPVEKVVGDLGGLRERVRVALTSDAPPRSERDERGIGQPNQEINLTLPTASAVNSYDSVERRHGHGRRRTN